MIIQRREIGFNAGKDLLGLLLAKLTNEPFAHITIILAAIAGLASWNHVRWNGAGAIRCSERNKVIGTHGIPEPLLFATIGTAVSKVLKRPLKIIFREIVREFAYSCPSARVFHSLRFWVSAKPFILILTVLHPPRWVRIAAFIEIALALEINRVIDQSIALINTLSLQYSISLNWIVSSLTLQLKTTFSVIRTEPALMVAIAFAYFTFSVQPIFACFVSVEIFGCVGIFAVALCAAFWGYTLSIHRSRFLWVNPRLCLVARGLLIPLNYTMKSEDRWLRK